MLRFEGTCQIKTEQVAPLFLLDVQSGSEGQHLILWWTPGDGR